MSIIKVFPTCIKMSENGKNQGKSLPSKHSSASRTATWGERLLEIKGVQSGAEATSVTYEEA